MSCVARFACGKTSTTIRVDAAVIHYLLEAALAVGSCLCVRGLHKYNIMPLTRVAGQVERVHDIFVYAWAGGGKAMHSACTHAPMLLVHSLRAKAREHVSAPSEQSRTRAAPSALPPRAGTPRVAAVREQAEGQAFEAAAAVAACAPAVM